MTFQEEFAEDLGTIFPGFRGDLWGGLQCAKMGRVPFSKLGVLIGSIFTNCLFTDYVQEFVTYRFSI